jgi:hypothetical protein
MDGTKISLTIFWKNYEGIIKKYEFSFIVYRVTTDNLFLGRDFYNNYGKLPGAMHHEIEILDMNFKKFSNPVIFHYHNSIVENKPFVCYPLPIPTLDDVARVLKIWCLGTTLSMIWGFDFQHIFKGDDEEFYKILEIEYGIK